MIIVVVTVDSGFNVTTAMTSSRNLLTWELSTSSPIYNFQLNESGTVITNEETLAFLYAGSGTETTYTWDAEGVTYADILVVGGGGGGESTSWILSQRWWWWW
jgi:hypothetical protein